MSVVAEAALALRLLIVMWQLGHHHPPPLSVPQPYSAV